MPRPFTLNAHSQGGDIDFYHRPERRGRGERERERRVFRKDNAEDFAIGIKRDDGFTVLEWSSTVELAGSV